MRSRRAFDVHYSIPSGDKRTYWLSIATLRSDGTIALHFPKRPLRPGVSGVVKLYDGGENPFPEPQAMALLLLNPTRDRSQAYETFVRSGPPYEGLGLDASEIAYVHRIYFP